MAKFVFFLCILVSVGSQASTPIELVGCAHATSEVATPLTLRKQSEEVLATFMSYYKTSGVTPESLQNKAGLMVRHLALANNATVLSSFMIDLDMIKKSMIFRKPLLRFKYGIFDIFDGVKEFYLTNHRLEFPEGISEESRLVLLARVATDLAHHPEYNDLDVISSGDRTALFMELTAAVKMTAQDRSFGRYILKVRLASAVVDAYVEQLNRPYEVIRKGADKLGIYKALVPAIEQLSTETPKPGDFRTALITRIKTQTSSSEVRR